MDTQEKNTRNNEKNANGLCSIALLGTALGIGYVAGLFAAKKPGVEFKHDIEHEIDGLMENGKKIYQTIRTNTEKITGKLKKVDFNNNNVQRAVGV